MDAMNSKPGKGKSIQNRGIDSLSNVRKLQERNLWLGLLLKMTSSDGWAMKIFFVMLGGSIGALARYGVSLFAARFLGTWFPYGTLIVNLSGCFLIGLSFSLADRGLNIMNPSARLFFVTGFLGALTTFSTFAMETVSSVRAATYVIAAANFLCNNLIGGALVFLGMWLGR